LNIEITLSKKLILTSTFIFNQSIEEKLKIEYKELEHENP